MSSSLLPNAFDVVRSNRDAKNYAKSATYVGLLNNGLNVIELSYNLIRACLTRNPLNIALIIIQIAPPIISLTGCQVAIKYANEYSEYAIYWYGRNVLLAKVTARIGHNFSKKLTKHIEHPEAKALINILVSRAFTVAGKGLKENITISDINMSK